MYHFCGHYLFLPMFFNRALINWLLPKRWRLPAAALEDISTSVRIIARLLWTVHLDFSQEVRGRNEIDNGTTLGTSFARMHA